MFYIRVDGNEIIATGHVMRCISIAQEIKRRGEDTTFIIADERPKEIIINAGFKVLCLQSVWDDLDKEIEKMTEVIQQQKISFLLVDTYYVTEKYLREIGRYTKLAYIDDINAFVYPVDLLINYNIYASELGYETIYRSKQPAAKLLLGSEYAPLRKEFENVSRKWAVGRTRVLITSGGTDSYGVVSALLDELHKMQSFEQMDCYVVLGRFHMQKKELEEKWKGQDNVRFLVNISNMSDYMKMCDVAITAGGVTTYELCACGIPSIMYTIADNQLRIAKTVSDKKLMSYAGDVREDMTGCMNRIVRLLNEYIDDETMRITYSNRMQQAVDGKGCQRLVDELTRYHCQKG